MWEEAENLLVLGQFLALAKKKPSVPVFTQISLVLGLEEVSQEYTGILGQHYLH